MSSQTWQETLAAAQVAGTLLNAFTTAKSVSPLACVVTLPPNWWYVGRCIRVTVVGAESHVVTTPGSISFQMMGGSASPPTVILGSSGAMFLTTTAHTTIPFLAQCYLTCRTIGTTGALGSFISQWTVEGQGFAMTTINTSADNAAGTGWAMGPNTAPAVTSPGMATDLACNLDFFTAFSINSAGNGIQVHQYIVESLN